MTPLVEAARNGDGAAWAALVRRWQDFAVAVAVGRSPSWEDARDAAQEAFGAAFVHLGELRDADAFAPWLAALVRSACSRRTRRRHLPEVTADDVELAGPDTDDPAVVSVGLDEERRVRAAIEALEEPLRSVIALHYLGGLTYPEVGAFLGIGTSAAKKRAWTARRHLKELLPMAARALQQARPSRTNGFSDTVLLFSAIRRRDAGEVARLLGKSPELAKAHEEWSVDEALEAGLLYAGKASALTRAAQCGDLATVELLVGAGAAVSEVCGCAGAETALWAATLAGANDVVAYLLQAGADPNVPAFEGATPLHVAMGRGHQAIARALLDAGADAGALDVGGRAPREWAPPPGPAQTGTDEPAMLVTGVRALDLFAPLLRGGLQYWPPAYGLGQFVLLFEIARALAPVRCWFVGFSSGPYDEHGIQHEIAETGVDVIVALAPAGGDPGARREHFTSVLSALGHDHHDEEKLVVCLSAPGHEHDVTTALPEVTADPRVLTTIVVAPFTGAYPPIGDPLPEGYGGRVVFDPQRARRRLWPAIDPTTTISRRYPSERHRLLARHARDLLAGYLASDPRLERPDPATFAEPRRAAIAQELLDYLAQPFAVREPFTSLPGQSSAIGDVLDTVERSIAAVVGTG